MDRLKDGFCASGGLELLRVDSPFLGRFGQFTLLSYLVECWFLFRSFEQAEESGAFGPYADFDPSWVVALRPNGRGMYWPYAVDVSVRLRILKLYEARGLPEPSPGHGHLRTHGDDAQVAAYVPLRVPNDLYLLAETSLRAFRFRTGRAPFELAEELAVLDLGVCWMHTCEASRSQWTRGLSTPCGNARRVRGRRTMGWCGRVLVSDPSASRSACGTEAAERNLADQRRRARRKRFLL